MDTKGLDLFGLGKLSDNTLELIKIAYPDLLQPSVKNIGSALGTVTEYLNVPLLKLRLNNETAKLTFKRNMDLLKDKLDSHDESEIGQASVEIGIPVIENLMITTNVEIANLFTTLLTNASLIDRSKYAHPNFINTIKSISADEALVLKCLWENRDPSEIKNSPIIYVRYIQALLGGTDGVPMAPECSNINDLVSMATPENNVFYFYNLLQLGLVSLGEYYDNEKEDEYETLIRKSVSTRREVEKKIEEHNLSESDRTRRFHLVAIKGIVHLTSFGERFVEACFEHDN